jgi:hypothetical protein
LFIVWPSGYRMPKLSVFTRIGGKFRVREKIVDMFPPPEEYKTYEPIVRCPRGSATAPRRSPRARDVLCVRRVVICKGSGSGARGDPGCGPDVVRGCMHWH